VIHAGRGDEPDKFRCFFVNSSEVRRAFTTLRFNAIEGAHAEFGSHGGMTFGLAHRESRRIGYNCPMWAFDSFSGLPPQSLPEDQHPAWIQRTEDLAAAVPPNVQPCRNQT
jgi:hypothetical protein